MQTRIRDSLQQIEPAAWNTLNTSGQPFLRHEFLSALETTGCASRDSGWLPCHVVCEDDSGNLIGALPLYLKTNPYGEFVFDYAWAGAYQRAGLSYYPKLVSAVPFTPATGPRILTAPDANRSKIAKNLLAEATSLAARSGASSLHVLFPNDQDCDAARASGLLLRKDCQFHWTNRGYDSFDEFLDTFTSVKRKKTRRERRRIREAGIEFHVAHGHELTPKLWSEIMPLYASTFLMRGREPYINRSFFIRVSETMPDNIVVFMARQDEELVGVSICFRSDTTLYGRYWGASRFIDSLHFETCYYRGIDYCIAHRLERFEPGTQGEHKVARGFVPQETWSAHWLSHPQFAEAVDDYLERERVHIDSYIDALGEHVPYKNQGQ